MKKYTVELDVLSSGTFMFEIMRFEQMPGTLVTIAQGEAQNLGQVMAKTQLRIAKDLRLEK